ncbi:uncharacterized protein N0V89_001322 [Didymosphaeria variabile]|uniref:Uncharacterized protein n=1 Tax=Didymosphaeria variabile TaxID=1932322 RepID=A0A9W9CGM7_9PLEO|nr:uncharacterized protein N0V89_001322 [Didymosphaeria variabile]KAJ4360755.1 hypothetical protein N0V89_001322 [Didymosphaeria variabile]
MLQVLQNGPDLKAQPNQTRIGITETQKAQLAQRISSKTSKEENWYMIYEILFPGCRRPETPYLDGTQFAEELFALRESAVQVAPIRINQLTSALHHEGKLPPVPPEYLEAFAFAAAKDVFDTVIGQHLRSSVAAKNSRQTNPVHPSDSTSPAPSSVTLKRSPSATKAKPFVLGETSFRVETSIERSVGEAGPLDHLLPSIVEGTKAWTGLEEPSRLDLLSMVADMDSRSWDEHLNTCVDGALQQPLK